MKTREAFRATQERLREATREEESGNGAAAAEIRASAFAHWDSEYELLVAGQAVRVRLREMTGSQVRQASETCKQRARDAAHEARILDAIGQHVLQIGAASVGDAYTPAELERMFS